MANRSFEMYAETVAKANALIRAGEAGKAVGVLDKAGGESPNTYPVLHVCRGFACVSERRWQEARREVPPSFF